MRYTPWLGVFFAGMAMSAIVLTWLVSDPAHGISNPVAGCPRQSRRPCTPVVTTWPVLVLPIVAGPCGRTLEGRTWRDA